MKQAILVFLGGGIGSLARFGTARALRGVASAEAFPYATLVVNLVGCLLVGMIAAWVGRASEERRDIGLLLATGFCGGLTTFSTFAHEASGMMRDREPSRAFLYLAVSVVLGLALAMLGYHIGRRA